MEQWPDDEFKPSSSADIGGLEDMFAEEGLQTVGQVFELVTESQELLEKVRIPNREAPMSVVKVLEWARFYAYRGAVNSWYLRRSVRALEKAKTIMPMVEDQGE